MRESATLPQVHASSPRRWRMSQAVGVRMHVIALAGGLGLVALLATFNLGAYPAIWFDEGAHVQVAMNLAHGASYAQISADGTLDYAPSIGVGPTVMLPVAALLRISGDSLAAARLVTVAYLLVATLLLYVIASFLFGRVSASVTIGLLLALPALDWIATGRQVLGEVPAFAFLLAGGIIATRNSCFKGATLAGFLFGLTLVTKGQYLLVLPVAIVVLGLVDRLDRRQRSLAWFSVVVGVAVFTWAAWMASLVLLIDGGQVVENVRLLRASSSGALIVFDLDRMTAGMRLILSPATFGLVVPSLVAGVIAMRRAEGKRRFGLHALIIFQGLWFCWFVFASIAWQRYAFPALALNTVLGGWLIVSCLRAVPAALSRVGVRSNARSVQRVLVASVVIAGALILVVQFRPLFTERDDTAQSFARVVDSTVPAEAVVDGWEPEIGFLSTARIQYPALGSLDRVVRARWLGGPPIAEETVIADGEYLMVGPFGRWVGVYEARLASSRYELVERVGAYELWKRLDAEE
jgi:4-amino-4-deoxy-L-arabinose transferase-like glycosyltransferase